MITKSCNGLEEWLWERFYFRSHSQLRCLGLLPLRRRRRPASYAKLSDRARLVTVAPTLSPMPNGKPSSGASATAEFASSAIAFHRIDYSRAMTREVRWRRFVPSGRLHRALTKRSNKERDKKILRPRSR